MMKKRREDIITKIHYKSIVISNHFDIFIRHIVIIYSLDFGEFNKIMEGNQRNNR
jgi:hypothetical protein